MPSTQGLASFTECQALGEIQHQAARIKETPPPPGSILSPGMLRKRKTRLVKWLRRLKVLAAEANHLSYIPRTHRVEGLLWILSDPYIWATACVYTHTHMHA